MVDKLIDLILKLAEMRFGARPVLVRDLMALHQALEDCHQKYLRIGTFASDDSEGRENAKAEHKKATGRLIKSLYKFRDLFLIHASQETWDGLQSYAALEAAVHPDQQFLRIVDLCLKDNQSGDYETAIKKLRDYMRENLKPEEIHGSG